MRVLVCGGRDFNDSDIVFNTLNELHEVVNITDIIHGCARGVDALASIWAQNTLRHDSRFIREWRYPADWKTHGKAAGPIRNQRMLDEGRPDLVVAFPGGKGTRDMVRRAREANIKLTEIT